MTKPQGVGYLTVLSHRRKDRWLWRDANRDGRLLGTMKPGPEVHGESG